MNTLRNKVQLIGRLGQEPEFTTFSDGNKIAKFPMATDDSYKDKDGNLITNNDTTSVNFKHIDPEYCMVEWYETYTSVTTDNNVRGVSASGLTQTKKSESRLCTGEYNNVCPVLNSETIKYDCGNLDKSINQGIAALNTMEKVVKDMICNITN
jgi:single-strand DNA-binding protein